MIDFYHSRQDRSVTRQVNSSTVVTDEGMLLVVDPSQPNSVKPSAGAAGEQIAGFSVSQQLSPSYLPYVDNGVPNASAEFTTSFTPISGSLFIIDTTTGTVQTAGTPGSNPNQYSISGNVITFNTAQKNDTMLIQYRYVPTAVQWQAVQGNVLPGGDSGALLNVVGVIVAGDIYTSIYDTSANWQSTSAPIIVSTSANGMVTIGGSGTVISPTVRVLAPPTATNPFLGLSISNG